MKLIKKVVYIGLLMTLPVLATAEDYYVSRAGNDTWSGTLVEPNEQRTDGPFRTISHLNGILFSEGDRISLRRGDVWHEPLVINDPGITIDAYGTGSPPLLDMAEPITGWEPYQGSIYVAECTYDVVQVFADDRRIEIAHHPNEGFSYADADASSTSYLMDDRLQEIPHDLVGAQILMRARHWVWYGRRVSAIKGNRLEFDPSDPSGSSYPSYPSDPKEYDIKRNYGYILTQQLWMLDKPGEWYHDQAQGKLYIWLGDSGDPNDHQLMVSRYDNGILFDHVSNVTVENIAVAKARGAGVRFMKSTAISLKGCLITDSGEFGIQGDPGSEHQHIAGNTIDDSILGGIAYFRYGISNNTIENNTVTDTFTSRVLRPVNRYRFGWGAGIRVSGGLNNVIRNNRVTNSGYSSVIVVGENNTVERNILENSCLLLDDGGGIYINKTGHVISENIIRNAVGNSEGTPSFFNQHHGTQAQGIYPDDRSGDVQILNNTIINANHGIFLHNSTQNTVRGNTLYGTRRSSILISEDAIVGIPGFVHDNSVDDNIFLSFSPTQAAVWLSGKLGQADFGTYDRNYYAHPYSDIAVQRHLPSDRRDFTLQQWQAFSGFDTGSVDMAEIFTIRPYIVDGVTGETLLLNGSFDANKSSWSNGWSPDNTLYTEWTPDGGLDGGCIRSYSLREGKSRLDSLTTSNHFEVIEGVDYRIRFSLRANNADTVSVLVRRNGPPDYSPVGFNQQVAVGPERRDHEFVFKATVSHEDSLVEFVSGHTSETTYYIDNVSLEPVNARYTRPIEDIILLVNESDTRRAIQLRGRTYLDINGNEVTGSVQLAPFRSVILINHNKYETPLPEQETGYDPAEPSMLGKPSQLRILSP